MPGGVGMGKNQSFLHLLFSLVMEQFCEWQFPKGPSIHPPVASCLTHIIAQDF